MMLKLAVTTGGWFWGWVGLGWVVGLLGVFNCQRE